MKNSVFVNILAVIAGLVIGSFINGGLISISGFVIPPPQGIDVTTEEGLKAALPLFEPKHFLFPFLAHALGTLSGAFIATKIAKTYRLAMVLIIGFFFLIGGIIMVFMVPSPIWFNVVDLVFAYIPMAFIGYRLGRKK